MMGLLVVYCLRSVDVSAPPHGLPELIAIAVTAGLHLWKRNTLISIGAGTVVYMLLVQLIFCITTHAVRRFCGALYCCPCFV